MRRGRRQFVKRLVFLGLPQVLSVCAPKGIDGAHGEFGNMMNSHGIALGCSWYCGAPPVSVKVGGDAADELHDGDAGTVWIANKARQQTLIFEFNLAEADNESGIGVDWVTIINGDARSKKEWQASARAKTFVVRFNGKLMGRYELADTMRSQPIELPRMRFAGNRVNELSFEILDTYPGQSSDMLSMADFYFAGFGKIH